MPQLGPTLPVSAVFVAAMDFTSQNPNIIKTVAALKQKMAHDAGDEELFLGALKYLAQKKYIEIFPKKEDLKNVTMEDSFSILATGISTWFDWYNRTEPKPPFY